jgi:hypothetical protein
MNFFKLMSSQEKIDDLLKKIKTIDNQNLDILLKKINIEIEKIKWSSSKKNKHKTIKVKHPDGDERDIDKNIAELIDCLWKLDIMTFNSCQNNYINGYIWIEFSSYEDLMLFMNLVIVNTDPINHHRILYGRHHEDKVWFHKINYVDSTIYDDNEDSSSFSSDDTIYLLPPGFSVRFPKTDYKMILNIMKNKIKQNNLEDLSE